MSSRSSSSSSHSSSSSSSSSRSNRKGSRTQQQQYDEQPQERYRDKDIERERETERDREREVTTSIKGDINRPIQTAKKAEVLVQTKEVWDLEALQKLEETIAKEKSSLIDAEKLVKDQTILFSEAQKTRDDKLISAQRLERIVTEKASERDRWLEEERAFELKRAEAHNRAVQMESSRTETLAQAVLSKEEAKVSESLSIQRQEGIKQAQALVDAHRLALQRLEASRAELKRKEIDVSVLGEALPQPRAVDINVAVKPLDLPEARISAGAVSSGAGASSHIHESLPVHQKTVLPADQVKEQVHSEQRTVERHVVSTKRDQVIS